MKNSQLWWKTRVGTALKEKAAGGAKHIYNVYKLLFQHQVKQNVDKFFDKAAILDYPGIMINFPFSGSGNALLFSYSCR